MLADLALQKTPWGPRFSSNGAMVVMIKNIQNIQVGCSDLSRNVEIPYAKDLKAIVVLEHLRPITFRESDDSSFQLGPMHAINWTSSLEILTHLLKLVCAVSGLGEEYFTISPAFHYEIGRRAAKPTVGIFANDGVVIEVGILREIDVALASFCRRVLEGQEIQGQEQLFPTNISARTSAIVVSMADEFLLALDGKKVGEARLLRTSSSELMVAGAYRPRCDRPLPAPDQWSVVGEIDGIRGITRTAFINVGRGKTIAILYDESAFKSRLRQRVLDGSIYDFVIESEWIAHEKKVDSLVSFRLCDGSDTTLL